MTWNPQKIEIEIRKTTAKAKKIQRTRQMKSNYLKLPMFKIDIKKQLDKRKQFSKDLKSKKFRKSTKIIKYTKRFI